MSKFYIQSRKEYWTGNSWTTAPRQFAKKYSFDDGLAIINKRFANGISKRTNVGDIYTIPRPVLVSKLPSKKLPSND